ncbi:MAG: hypothetical protein OMOMHJEC_01648 [Xanthomonadales bacterium]|nr:hypothetical protein [Xanthomonadales bacterium]
MQAILQAMSGIHVVERAGLLRGHLHSQQDARDQGGSDSD